MATTFDSLFQAFLQRKIKDVDLLTLLTPDELSRQLNGYLEEGREEFYDLVIEVGGLGNKLGDVDESDSNIYEYSFTGTSDTRVLDPKPKDDSEFYVTVNEVVWTDFTYDENTGELTISNAPDQTNQIYASNYYDGKFNQTLNKVEFGIMLDYIQLAFQDQKLIDACLLTQSVYGADYHLHSQANHIREAGDMYDVRRNRVEKRVIRYTYRQDPDNLRGLGGKQ